MQNASSSPARTGLAACLAACLCVFGLSLTAGPVHTARAQGTAQVQFLGLPPQLPSLRLEVIERIYRTGRYPVQFIYNDPSGQAASFRFVLSVTLDGDPVLEMVSAVTRFTPGIYLYRTFRDDPRVQFPGGFGGLVNRLDGRLLRALRENGRLPSGNYTVTLEAEPADPSRLIASLPARASLTGLTAEPPTLIYPDNGVTVTEATPQFSWSPATGLPGGTMTDYTLRIVEMRPGQTPLQALQGNIPNVETVQTGVTTFTYLPNELPLQNGQRYVWQVIARDANGVVPFAQNGETEINTFIYGDPGVERYVWQYPSENDPFIEIPLPEYSSAWGGGLVVSGVYVGTVAGETVWADFGTGYSAAEFAVEGTAPNARLTLTWGTVKLSNGMTLTPSD